MDRIERRDEVVRLNRDGGDGEAVSCIGAVGENSIAVLEELHGPAIFSPLDHGLPFIRIAEVALVDAYEPVAVHVTRLNHGGEEKAVGDATSVDGRTSQARELSELAGMIHSVNEVRFQRRVG